MAAPTSNNDYIDNLILSSCKPLYQLITESETASEAKAAVEYYAQNLSSSIIPDSSGLVDMQGVYAALAESEYSSNEQLSAAYTALIESNRIIGKKSSAVYDFESSNPFVNSYTGTVYGILARIDGNGVFSLKNASDSSKTDNSLLPLGSDNWVTDGVLTFESDVWVDYDIDSSITGMATITVDSGDSSNRVSLFGISKTGKAVSANGAYGALTGKAFADYESLKSAYGSAVPHGAALESAAGAQVVTGFSAGDDVYTRVTLANNSSSSLSMRAYAALYSSDGTLISVAVSEEKSVAARGSDYAFVKLSVSEDIGSGSYIKTFALSDALLPYCASAKLQLR